MTRTPGGLRFDLPVRRSTRTWLLGGPALVVGTSLTAYYVGVVLFISFTRSNVVTGLVTAVVGAVWMGISAVPFALLGLLGAYAFFGSMTLDVQNGRLEIRRRLGGIRTPAAVVIRDVHSSVRVVETGRDFRGRPAVVAQLTRGIPGVRQPSSPVFLGAGYLSSEQAVTLADTLRQELALESVPGVPEEPDLSARETHA